MFHTQKMPKPADVLLVGILPVGLGPDIQPLSVDDVDPVLERLLQLCADPERRPVAETSDRTRAEVLMHLANWDKQSTTGSAIKNKHQKLQYGIETSANSNTIGFPLEAKPL